MTPSGQIILPLSDFDVSFDYGKWCEGKKGLCCKRNIAIKIISILDVIYYKA